MIHDNSVFGFNLTNRNGSVEMSFNIPGGETVLLPIHTSVDLEPQAIDPAHAFILDFAGVPSLTLIITDEGYLEAYNSPGWKKTGTDEKPDFTYESLHCFKCHMSDGVIVVVGTVDIDPLSPRK